MAKRKQSHQGKSQPALEGIQVPGWLASVLLDTSDPGEPVILPVEPTQQAPKPLGLRLTAKQRWSLLHATRLKRKIKDRLQESSEGTQFIEFTEAELEAMQEEVNEAIRFAPTAADKKALQAVAKKIEDALHEQNFFVFKVKRPTKSGLGKKSATAATVYQLKITLQGTQPPIWRRVQTKDCSLARLHEIIQLAMGWLFSHLYEFQVVGERYGEPAFRGDLEWKSDHRMRLSQIVEAGHTKFTYVYDMGDNWEHRIRVEKVLSAEPKTKYPRCIAGARACPPEDSGGVWGYVEFLKAIGNPKHKEHDEMLEWVGGKFDPQAFDVNEVDRALSRRGR